MKDITEYKVSMEKTYARVVKGAESLFDSKEELNVVQDNLKI